MKRSNSESLPVLDTATESDCGGCSRRALLKALGVGAIGTVVLAGCQQGSAMSSATSTTCGTDVCIDLGNANNTELTNTNGAMLVDVGGDTVAVIRTSETAVVALSAICTHSGCEMDYNTSTQQMDCGCHGSVFRLDGTVVAGPAHRPVAVYQATLVQNTITIVP